MLKAAGAALVWGGCVFWGIRAAARRIMQLRTLEDIAHAIGYMERELVLNHTPLARLLRRCAEACGAQGKRLFLVCAERIEQGDDFAQGWQRETERMDLPEEDRRCLKTLGGILGRFQAQEQAEALGDLRRALEVRLTEERAEQRQTLRLYGILGMTAGGFLTLMLL